VSASSSPEPAAAGHSERLRVVIVGAGVAALESALALAELAPDLTDVTVIAPGSEFLYRPMAVREPFAGPLAHRYPLAPIIRDAGATLLQDELAWIDPAGRTIHTTGGQPIEYDVLVLALGASILKRYKHALTIDDHDLDETMHGLIQDVEGGFARKLAFVATGHMAWPLPLYELALMTAGRAYDADVDVEITIVTSEESPLAIFGASASAAVAERLASAGIRSVNSSYVEVPRSGEVVINPGDEHLDVDRVIALPELCGPGLRGIPLGERGFVPVDQHCRVRGVEHIYAAGDITDFPIKHGGIGSQQADVLAQSIAALAGAPLTPETFKPTMHGMLLTGGKPLYLTARITGGSGFSSQSSDAPDWNPPSKIAAKYLAPYLERSDREATPAAS
jgi:sulfide:quinone oxidoreductase